MRRNQASVTPENVTHKFHWRHAVFLTFWNSFLLLFTLSSFPPSTDLFTEIVFEHNHPECTLENDKRKRTETKTVKLNILV